MSVAEREPAGLHALILQHEEPTPPGHVTEWLAGHGARVEILRIDEDDREVDPTDYDLIVSLGSEFAAFDDTKPFVPREARPDADGDRCGRPRARPVLRWPDAGAGARGGGVPK